MKRVTGGIYFILLFMLFTSGVSAGEIYLRNKTVVKGTNIEIVNDRVKYTKEGEKESVTIKTEKVERIIYDNGTVLNVALRKTVPASGKGVIILNSGENIPFESLMDKGDYVEYVPRGAAYHNYLRKRDIQDIKYGDPKEIFLGSLKRKHLEEKKKEEYYRVVDNKIPEGGFHSSFIWISLFGGFGEVYGDFEKYEDDMYDTDKGLINNDDNYYNDTYTESYYGGVDLNILLFTGKMIQKRAFNLTGIGIGIKGRYQDVTVYQGVLKYYDTDSDGFSEDEKRFTGNLMEFQSWQAGPTFDLIFSPRENSFNFVAHSFLIGGVIHKGELNAAPGLRESGVVYDKSEYSSGFKGYIYTLGTGLFFVLNRGFPVTAGLTFTYSHANLTLDRELPLYGNRKSLGISSKRIEFSCGVHI